MLESGQRAVGVEGSEGFRVHGFGAVFGVQPERLLDQSSLMDELLAEVFEVCAFEGVVNELRRRVVHVQVLFDGHIGEARFLALLDVVEVAADERLGQALHAEVLLQGGEAFLAVEHSLQLLYVDALALLVEDSPGTRLFALYRCRYRVDQRLLLSDVLLQVRGSRCFQFFSQRKVVVENLLRNGGLELW